MVERRRCVAGWIDARQAHEVDFSGCSRKNDGHDIDDEISMSHHWQGHSPEEIQAMKDAIAGLEPIDD